MKRLILFTLIGIFLLGGGRSSFADDSDIYNAAGQAPNVLIVFDNSKSMKDVVPYDDDSAYPELAKCGPLGNENCMDDGLYFQCCSDWTGSTCQQASGGTNCKGENCQSSLEPSREIMLAQEIGGSSIAQSVSASLSDALFAPAYAADTCVVQGICQDPPACSAGQYRECPAGKERFIRVIQPLTWRDSDPRDGIYDWGGTENTFKAVGVAGCPSKHYYVYRGNRINYDYGPKSTKVDEAKRALISFLNATSNVRFGLMIFNLDHSPTSDGGVLVVPCSDTGKQEILDNIFIPVKDPDPAKNEDYGSWHWCWGKRPLCGPLGDRLFPQAFTPLAETLTDAGKYFEGNYTYPNTDLVPSAQKGTTPIPPSPITHDYPCQKDYVIIITDGLPSHDLNPTILGKYLDPPQTTPGAAPGANRTLAGWSKPSLDTTSQLDNTAGYNKIGIPNPSMGSRADTYDEYQVSQHFLDDVAWVLNNTGVPSPNNGRHYVRTYTIGFTVKGEILQKAADKGGGKYATAQNAAGLTSSLRYYMSEIQGDQAIFASATVPPSGIVSGDRLYVPYALTSSTQGFRGGDLKRFTMDNPLSVRSNPDWSANDWLKNMTNGGDSRNIYTWLDRGNKKADDLKNQFNLDKVKKSDLDVTSEDDRKNIINFIRGQDVLNNKTGMRPVVLGSIAHSAPLVVKYTTGSVAQSNSLANAGAPRRVFFGANDAMLHCVDDNDGSEQWAFIPPVLLTSLQTLITANPTRYFVDGSPKLAELNSNHYLVGPNDSVAQRIIIFGLRKGGSAYYALDVTDQDHPEILWEIKNQTPGFGELGQTWSDPVFGHVKQNGRTKAVVFFGAGYSPDDTKGRGVYAVDIRTGDLIWSKTFDATGFPDMKFSIASQVLAFDSNGDDYIDRLYVGDLGGQMWAFGYFPQNDSDPKRSDPDIDTWTARLLFKSDPNAANGARTVNRQIYYPPDLVIEADGYYIYFGTGNRDNPTETTVTNRFYCVKDKNSPARVRIGNASIPFISRQEANLVNLTSDVLQGTDAQAKADTLNNLQTMDGWYIIMNQQGEKVLAPPTVFMQALFFSTFSPLGNASDPCVSGGVARVYAVNSLTAVSITNWATDASGRVNLAGTGLTGDQRSKTLSGGGIPTEVTIVLQPPQTSAGGAAAGSVTGNPLVASGRNVESLPALTGQIYLTPYTWGDKTILR